MLLLHRLTYRQHSLSQQGANDSSGTCVYKSLTLLNTGALGSYRPITYGADWFVRARICV